MSATLRPALIRRRPDAIGRVSGVVVLAGLVVVYQLWSISQDSLYFPSLRAIGSAFWRTWTSDAVTTHALPSMVRMVLGYLLAALVGISLGIGMGRMPRLTKTIDPFVQFLRAIPPPALVPIAVLVLGINSRMQILIIALGSVWPILLNTVEGSRNVPSESLDSAAMFRLGRFQVLRRVVVPSASPSIFAGLRVGLSLALIMMVVSELTASANGLGYFVLRSERLYQIPEMYAGILLIGLIGIVINKLFLALEGRLLAWRFTNSQGVK